VSSGPRRRGFGSELIEGRIPYELQGRGKVTIENGAARCHLEFPLKDGASVLETNAPQRAEVFGGAIDMSGETDLGGQRILVVEDDYYLATDTARALQSAGAEVLGPCPSEAAAREELAKAPVTGAILDINLNGGRSFRLAGELKVRDVPFIFITGYDQEVIPPEFEDIARLQKPVQFRQIVGALAKALGIER
jgi:CheY-like chemotaxis protein